MWMCVHMCGQIAFVLSPQAYTQMSVSRVELIQVTNALNREALFTVATQSPNNNPTARVHTRAQLPGNRPIDLDPIYQKDATLLTRC